MCALYFIWCTLDYTCWTSVNISKNNSSEFWEDQNIWTEVLDISERNDLTYEAVLIKKQSYSNDFYG